MILEKLVKMANQIGDNFAYLKDTDAAAAKVADHICRFWDPLMRSEITEYMNKNGEDLSDIAKRAIEIISAN